MGGRFYSKYKKIKELDFIKLTKSEISKDFLCTFTFDKKELKQLDFRVIVTDNEFYKNSQDTMSGVGIPWENINTLDFSIKQALEIAEKDGTLIDETEK